MLKLFRTFFLFIIILFFSQFALSEERAYVTNWESDNLSVIDISSNTVTGTIPTDTGPHGLAFTPDYEYVYVTNYGSAACNNKVTVIRTSDNTIQGIITVGNCPAQIAITPDGEYGYVANYFSDTFSVIEISSNTVMATVSTGDGPMGVTITPDGQYAYFAMEQAGTVQVVQTSDNTIIATISVGSSPYRIAITPDGAYAYVTNRFSDNVSVIRTSDNTVIATVGVGAWPHGVAITPDGEYAYVVNFFMSNNVSVIQTSSNTVVNTIPVGSWPKAIAFTADGEYAYVTNGGGNSISVIQISTSIVVATIPVNTNPSGIIIGDCLGGPGWIEGTVFLEGGTGNVEDVIVAAGIESTNPNATGFYSIEIEPGTYDVTATLEYYETDTVYVVVVEEGVITSGVDLTLIFAPPLNPPENLVIDFLPDNEALLTWDSPVPAPGTTLLGYNVYLDDMVNPVGSTTFNYWLYEGLMNGQWYIAGVSAVYEEGESLIIEMIYFYPGTGAEDDILSYKTELIGNYPNPFKPTTNISFNLTAEHTESAETCQPWMISIYNIKGQKVKSFHTFPNRGLGTRCVVWDGIDENNQPVNSGIYFYQLKIDNKPVAIKKMLLLR